MSLSKASLIAPHRLVFMVPGRLGQDQIPGFDLLSVRFACDPCAFSRGSKKIDPVHFVAFGQTMY